MLCCLWYQWAEATYAVSKPPRMTRLAVVVLTFNRPELLRRFLVSLSKQEYRRYYELVVYDNGSVPPVFDYVRDLLPLLPQKTKLLRAEENIVGPTRLAQAIRETDAEYILCPGDDDVLHANYLSVMDELARSSRRPTLISAACRQVNIQGKSIRRRWTPPAFEEQWDALANLMLTVPYAFPATGFRRDVIEFTEAPRSRTALDWWLWIQCWLAGRGLVSSETVIDYTWHPGQEQAHYGTQAFRIDGAQMLASVINSNGFKNVVSTWTKKERVAFVDVILKSSGINRGDSRLAPFVQIQLAELLSGTVPDDQVLALYAQAAGQMTYFLDPGHLAALGQKSYSPAMSPWTWSRVPVRASWTCTCRFCSNWRLFLQLPESPNREIRLEFRGLRRDASRDCYEIAVTGERSDANSRFSHRITEAPSMATVQPLLEHVATLRGIERGYETLEGFEARLWRLIARWRYSFLGSQILIGILGMRSKKQSM